jgi:hypothetical protein
MSYARIYVAIEKLGSLSNQLVAAEPMGDFADADTAGYTASNIYASHTGRSW